MHRGSEQSPTIYASSRATDEVSGLALAHPDAQLPKSAPPKPAALVQALGLDWLTQLDAVVRRAAGTADISTETNSGCDAGGWVWVWRRDVRGRRVELRIGTRPDLSKLTPDLEISASVWDLERSQLIWAHTYATYRLDLTSSDMLGLEHFLGYQMRRAWRDALITAEGSNGEASPG